MGGSLAARASPAGPKARPLTVHLVATPGGHLDLLLSLRPVLQQFRRVWVVSPGANAEALRRAGEEVRTLPRWHGLNPRTAARSGPAVMLAAQERPAIVVTSGSGNMVPFCLTARLLGARLIFLETMARIADASQTGRALSRFADEVLVQWPDMREHYPEAIVCRPALLDEAIGGRWQPRTTGTGTFVAVGTHVDRFDRLLRMVDEAVRRGVLSGPAMAQTGTCAYEPEHLDSVPWVSPAELEQRIRTARHFVCHAGSGLISRALDSGLRPIVVPRRAALGEHVDDHQSQLTHRLAQYDLVVPADDAITTAHVRSADRPRSEVSQWDLLPRIQDILPALVAGASDAGRRSPGPAGLILAAARNLPRHSPTPGRFQRAPASGSDGDRPPVGATG